MSLTTLQSSFAKSASCPLLNLPVEVRESILRYSFGSTAQIRLRSPSHRRLRPSRIDKDDPQGLLGTCHTLREEAISVFYASTTIIFHSSNDAMEYLKDPKIDPFIKTRLTHLAMDDGDCQCTLGLLQRHLWLVCNAYSICQNLKTLECRIYARHDDRVVLSAVKDLVTDWKTLIAISYPQKGATALSPSNARIKAECKDLVRESVKLISSRSLSVRVIQTHAAYEGESIFSSNAPTVAFSCCNIIVDRDEKSIPVLGDAQEAVERRKARVGAIRATQSEFYENDIRCPDDMENHFMKDYLASQRLTQTHTPSGISRHTWTAPQMQATSARA